MSDEVARSTCFRLNGFKSYYKFTREKKNKLGRLLRASRLRHAETLNIPFFNCHDVNEIFFSEFRAQQIL